LENNHTDSASADSVRISERDVVALRAMRPILRRALAIVGEALGSGVLHEAAEHTVKRAIESLAIVDRLTGDGPDLFGRDEHTLTCVRIGNGAGYDVTFGADGNLWFAGEAGELFVSGELLDIDEPIDEALTAFLANATDGHAAFDAWLHSHRAEPE
jgi:hypothetical protein